MDIFITKSGKSKLKSLEKRVTPSFDMDSEDYLLYLELKFWNSRGKSGEEDPEVRDYCFDKGYLDITVE